MRKGITDSATTSFFLAQPSLHLNEKTQPADDKGHPGLGQITQEIDGTWD